MITRIESDSYQPHPAIPIVITTHNARLATRAAFGTGEARAWLAMYVIIATPIARVRGTHTTQNWGVQGSGCLIAAVASSHSRRMNANQATTQTRL